MTHKTQATDGTSGKKGQNRGPAGVFWLLGFEQGIKICRQKANRKSAKCAMRRMGCYTRAAVTQMQARWLRDSPSDCAHGHGTTRCKRPAYTTGALACFTRARKAKPSRCC